jgi:nucleoside-diphosphate-sugar epimerase
MNILVIGGTGFIGPYVVQQLVEEGHEVCLFHRGLTSAHAGSCDVPSPVRFIHGEREKLRDFRAQLQAFAPEIVLDMIPFSEEDALTVVDALGGITQRLVAISSADVYRAYGCFHRTEDGLPSTAPLSEDAPLREEFFPYRKLSKEPGDLADRYEKILVERVVLGNAHLAGTVLRLPAVFGPHDRQHRLAAYLESMDAGEDIILEEGKAAWRWSRGYVEDVAAAIALAAISPDATHRTYNVGEERALAEIEWVREIGVAAGWSGEIHAIPRDELPSSAEEPYDWRYHLFTDTSRIRQELGFREKFSQREALDRTIAWERANRNEPSDEPSGQSL